MGKDHGGYTPLMLAAIKGNLDICRDLIDGRRRSLAVVISRALEAFNGYMVNIIVEFLVDTRKYCADTLLSSCTTPVSVYNETATYLRDKTAYEMALLTWGDKHEVTKYLYKFENKLEYWNMYDFWVYDCFNWTCTNEYSVWWTHKKICADAQICSFTNPRKYHSTATINCKNAYEMALLTWGDNHEVTKYLYKFENKLEYWNMYDFWVSDILTWTCVNEHSIWWTREKCAD